MHWVISLLLRCFGLAVLAEAVGSGGEESRHRSVIRAEKAHKAELLGIGADGDLYGMGHDPDHDVHGPGIVTDPDQPEAVCNDVYPLGEEGTSFCSLPHHNQIIDVPMCEQAAALTGAKIEKSHFVIDDERAWDTHPRGCFAAPCKKEHKGKTCYWYNPTGELPCGVHPKKEVLEKTAEPAKGGAKGEAKEAAKEPAAAAGADAPAAGGGAGGAGGGGGNGSFAELDAWGSPKVLHAKCTGTPVCFTVKYINGTKDTYDECKAGYSVIDNEEKCRAAASCLGFCAGEEFVIGEDGFLNASRHLDYPKGCFIDPSDDCVYYNSHHPLGISKHPRGIPLCNATSEGHFFG